jgi:hypothetical protein
MKPVTIELKETVKFSVSDLDEGMISLIQDRLTFRNPLFGKPPRFGRDLSDVPPVLKAWHEEDGRFFVARGWFEELVRLLHAHGYQPTLENSTPQFGKICDFDSRLHKEMWGIDFQAQYDALTEISRHAYAVLEGPPGSGKRMLASKLAHRRRVPVLVIVTERRALYLWQQELIKWGIPQDGVGILGDGRKEQGRCATVASSITLFRALDAGEFPSDVGYVIVDRVNEANWGMIFRLRRLNAAYVLGLANGTRADGLTQLMYAHVGPRVFVLHDVFRAVNPPTVTVLHTGARPAESPDWATFVSNLTGMEDRNTLIAADILTSTAERGRSVVVSERVGHLKDLAGQVGRCLGPEMTILHADTPEAERKRMVERCNRGYLKILGVTVRTVPALSELKAIRDLFVTTPMRPDDHLCALLYRMAEDGKQAAVVHEYLDEDPVLKGSLARRMKVYRRMGIRK